MPDVGQTQKKTQARVVKLFREQLRYDFLGDWTVNAAHPRSREMRDG